MPYANNRGIRIHYEVEGQGPPLMLMHGFSSSLESWRDAGFVKQLEGEYRLLLVDARGHGASDKPHGVDAYSMELMVGDLVAVLDSLDIDRAHYYGYSMGGRIGFRIPVYAPERFASLVLGGATYPLQGPEDAQDDLLVGIQRALEYALAIDPDRAIEAYVAAMESRFGPVPPRQRTALLANDARALLVMVKVFPETASPTAAEVLPRITLPCLLFAGDADSRHPSVRTCASRMPDASFFSLPGLDHLQAGLRTDVIIQRVKEFLARTSKS